MLIEFKFSNYRSFRDEAVLSMEATGVSAFKKSLIEFYPTGKETGNPVKLLPSVAIYGKNGGGKSNIIRAFWLAVQFIRNAQRTQHEKASIPVHPFLLDDISADMPSSFEFQYVLDGVRLASLQRKRKSQRNTCSMRPSGKRRWCFLAPDRPFPSGKTRKKNAAS